ncbi:hypothetical protein [Falsiroseomonas oryziterrae]|uniref:hypothetical protein n=1 Tax=Falsiroseomonas oryziterrae TaxID=2911368 RepID=UPI001F2CAAB5|nr:hypothetical protein [Roseomonas sp. NPKOSM-4]
MSGAVLVGLLLVVFMAVHIVHFRFFPVRVVAYAALLDVGIALVLSAAAWLLWLRRRLRTDGLESALFLAIATLVATLYAIMVPTVIDRSLSIYILEKLLQRGGAIREGAFEELLVREFFPEHQLVAVRLTEQLNSGTITISDGCVRLTRRGETTATWTRRYRTTLLPRHREIMGRFSDDLTDPFRHSTPQVDHRCQ